MFVEQLRRKAESASGKLVDLPTWSLKMSQYDHTTEGCTTHIETECSHESNLE